MRLESGDESPHSKDASRHRSKRPREALQRRFASQEQAPPRGTQRRFASQEQALPRGTQRRFASQEQAQRQRTPKTLCIHHNRVGARSLIDRASSHTTVRAVRHTAVRQLRRSASFTPTRPELNLSGRYFRCIAPFLWLFPAVHALRHSFILGFHPTFNDVAHFRGILRSRHDTTFRTCRNYCRSALPGSPVLWPLLTSRRSVMHHCMS